MCSESSDLEQAFSKLASALGLETREHLAVVGGGGKTSLLQALTRELNRPGSRVVATTTTRVLQRQAADTGRLILTEDKDWPDLLSLVLDSGHVAFLGRKLSNPDKVTGIDPELADELFVSGKTDFLVVEADGAAGRPLKAHEHHEPVVPESVSRVVAMAGLEALGQPMEDGLVFRMKRFEEVTGAVPGENLSVGTLSLLFSRPDGLFRGSPRDARLTAFLNKLDAAKEPERALELGREILGCRLPRLSEVVLGSIREGVYLAMTGK